MKLIKICVTKKDINRAIICIKKLDVSSYCPIAVAVRRRFKKHKKGILVTSPDSIYVNRTRYEVDTLGEKSIVGEFIYRYDTTKLASPIKFNIKKYER